MDLENVILSEVKSDKDEHYMSHMWNLKYNTNESVYKTEANVHRKQVYGNWKGEGIREGQIRSNR